MVGPESNLRLAQRIRDVVDEHVASAPDEVRPWLLEATMSLRSDALVLVLVSSRGLMPRLRAVESRRLPDASEAQRATWEAMVADIEALPRMRLGLYEERKDGR